MSAGPVGGILAAMDESQSQKADELYRILVPLWPDRGSPLSHRDCFQLLIAVILSAQCTDEQVNKATPALFAAFPGPAELAAADLARVEALIRSTGFYRNKAKNIIAAAGAMQRLHGGRVPDTMEALTALPGVGRKTANLVISVCFGKPGIVVDTHVLRIARRLGLAPTDDPARSERMIAASLPAERWTAFSYALNRHGKFVCRSRKPLCEGCAVNALCPSAGSLA